jgi:hypothetical protein
MYARQLAEHYNAGQGQRRAPAPGWENDPRYRRPRGSEDSEERDEREYSFFDGKIAQGDTFAQPSVAHVLS